MTFGGNKLHLISYLPNSYLSAKNEKKNLFDILHSVFNFSWLAFLRTPVKKERALSGKKLKSRFLSTFVLFCS